MKISWCATMSEKDKRNIQPTIDSIKDQSVGYDELLITEGGNISQGRNEYLKKAKGDILATFDGGCIYKKDYLKKMLKVMEETQADIVFGIVKPMKPKNKIQEFCISRLADYENFTEEDWKNFIPSNRQVIIKRDIINKLGLLPEQLWRSDDTYWFQKAKEEGLKFAYSPESVVYWEMKSSLKSYLKSVYNDTKCDRQYGIKPFGSSKRKKRDTSFSGLVFFFLAGVTKVMAILIGNLTKKEELK